MIGSLVVLPPILDWKPFALAFTALQDHFISFQASNFGGWANWSNQENQPNHQQQKTWLASHDLSVA